MRGEGGPLGEHFVLAVGLQRHGDQGWHLVAFDPWPGTDRIGPGIEIKIDPDSRPMMHPSLTNVVFKQMRLVNEPARVSPQAQAADATASRSTKPQANVASNAGNDTVAVKDGTMLVGAIAPVTLNFRSSFGDTRVPTDRIVEYKDGTLALSDGSTLKGTFSDSWFASAKLEIVTAAGSVGVPLNQVVSIHRPSIGAAAASTRQSSSTQQLPGDGRGLFVGRVMDNFNKPLMGVRVDIENTQFVEVTGGTGGYALPFVPGKISIRFSHAETYDRSLSLEVSGAATYPLANIVLHRKPPGFGMFAIGDNGYLPLASCTIESSLAGQKKEFGGWDEFAQGKPFTLYARGNPTPIASDSTIRILDTTNATVATYRVNDDGSYFQGRAGGFVESRPATSPFSERIVVVSSGVIERSMNLQPGYHVYAQAGGKLCFMFQIFPISEAGSAAFKQLSCYARPNGACLWAIVSEEFRSSPVQLVSALTEGGKIEAAANVVRTINDDKLRVIALSILARAQMNAGDKAGALQSSAQYLQTAASASAATGLQLLVWDNRLRDIAYIQAEAGDTAAALKTAQKVENLRRRAEAFVGLSGRFADTGDKGGANTVLQQAIAISETLENDGLLRFLLIDIARGELKLGNTERALSFVPKILDIILPHDVGTLQVIIQLQAAAGDLVGARQTLQDSKKELEYDAGLLAIALGQLEAGNPDGARSTAQQIRTPSWRDFAQNAVAMSEYKESGRTDMARKVLSDEVQKALSDVSQHPSQYCQKLQELTNVAAVQIQMLDLESARTTLTAASAIARPIIRDRDCTDPLLNLPRILVNLLSADAAAGHILSEGPTVSQTIEFGRNVRDSFDRILVFARLASILERVETTVRIAPDSKSAR